MTEVSEDHSQKILSTDEEQTDSNNNHTRYLYQMR